MLDTRFVRNTALTFPPPTVTPFMLPGLLNFWDTRQGYVFGDTNRQTPVGVNDGVNNLAKGMTDRASAGKHWQFATTAPKWNPLGYLEFPDVGSAYGSAGTVADFKCLHDATGGTLYLPFTFPDEKLTVLCNTGGLTNTHTGLCLYIDDASTSEGQLVCNLGNGSGTYMANLATTAAANVVPANTVHLLTFKLLDGAAGGDVQVKINGCPVMVKADAASPAAGNSTYAWQQGNLAGSLPARGRIYTHLIYNKWHTPAEERLVMQWFRENVCEFSMDSVAFLGDSITAGQAGTVQNKSPAEVVAEIKSYKYAIRANYDASNTESKITNYGVSGAAIADNGSTSTGNNLTVNQWTAYINSTSILQKRLHNKYVILAGINDIVSIGRTGAQCLADMITLVDLITAFNGNEVILCTLTPVDNYGSMDATKRGHVRTLNAGIRGLVGFANKDQLKVVDLWTAMNDGSGNFVSRFDSGDNIHPSQVGNNFIAQLIAPLI